MKNFLKSGERLSWTNFLGTTVPSGDIVEHGGNAAVALGDCAAGASVEVQTCGVFSFAKAATWAGLQGMPVYRDETDHTKVTITPGGLFVGVLEAAVSAAATTCRVWLRPWDSQPGMILIDEDFLGPVPPIDVEYGGSPYFCFKNTATKGGTSVHTARDAAGGGVTFTYDAVDEAVASGLFPAAAPALAKYGFLLDWFVTLNDLVDAAVDLNIGVASEFHASDMDSAAISALFHFDGHAADKKILAESDDGTNETAATDTTAVWVADTALHLRIDGRNIAAIKFFINQVQYLAATDFIWTAAALTTGRIGPIFHLEKSAGVHAPVVHVDRCRFLGYR